MSSILIIQLRFNFLNLDDMYLENYILKMIRHQTVRFKSFPERTDEASGAKDVSLEAWKRGCM